MHTWQLGFFAELASKTAAVSPCPLIHMSKITIASECNVVPGQLPYAQWCV